MYPEHGQEGRAWALSKHVLIVPQTFASWRKAYSEEDHGVPFKDQSLEQGP